MTDRVETPALPRPAPVATIGLHGSASSWVFIVARELVLAAAGEDRIVTGYADEPAQLPPEAERTGRTLVLKSHHGSEALDAWLKAEGAKIVLSLRDPRDAAISMAQRFRAPLNQTVAWLLNDCARMTRLAAEGYPLLRYEDRFFEDPAMVDRVAAWLGLAVAPEAAQGIFRRYETDAVRAFARSLSTLPPERVTMVGEHPMDRVTQILGPHIGDTSEGKWFELPGQVQGELARVFGPFLERFGYAP